MVEVVVRFGPCAGVPRHGQVLTEADDPEQFDPNVLGGGDFIEATVFGYCARCGQSFYWNADHHQWADAWERTPAAIDLERRAVLRFLDQRVYSFITTLLIYG